MQKKHENNIDNLIDKIVKKDYNNALESVLEKKAFSEGTKSLLLNILYKIETSYKDYKKVKPDVKSKEEIIEKIIDEIRENCDDIKLVTPYSEESKMLGNKTFLVEKTKKRIICQNIERKVLYCISKISKKDKIIQDAKTSSEILGGATVFCYPFGQYNDLDIKVLKENGYKLAFTTKGGRVKKGSSKYELPRVRISGNTGMTEFKKKVE